MTLLAVCLTSFAKQALENGAKSLGKLIEKFWGEKCEAGGKYAV